jgi:hypothetical protein
MKLAFALAISFILTVSLFAQNENPPMVTDRPDQTESAVTVPHKTLQIESGFTFGFRDKEGIETRDLGYNATLLRWGVLNRLEVRVGLAYAGLETTDADTEETTKQSGMAPLAIGFKWNMLEGDGPIPTLAFLSSVDIPALASDDFNDGNVLNRIILAGSWDLSNTFGLGFNFGTIADWKDSDFTTLYSTSLGISILDWLGAFVEFYGFLPAGEYSDHRFHAGFTFPVRHNLQFDLTGGVGISNNSPDGFAGFGFAWRIPH